jgi:hypothetical protein
MSLPRSLIYAVNRFQTAQRETVRLFPLQKRDFSENEVISFRFPASGVLDLQSLAMHFVYFIEGTGTTAGDLDVATPEYLSQLIRRVDVSINGVQVGLNALTDYGLAYLTKYKYADTGDRATFKGLLEGNLSCRIVSGGNNATVFRNGMIADWLGFLSGSHVRYLPLAALGELQIDITLHPRRRWVASDTSDANYAKISATQQLRNVRMLYTKVHFEDNLLDNMVAARLARGSMQIPFENWAQWEGNAFSGTTSFNFQVATQSLDHLFGALRPDNYSTTAANNVRLASGGETSTFQFSVNANPVSSWPLAVPEVFWATADALEGNNNALYAPSIATYADFRDRYFAYIHSFAFPLDADESKSMITGLSTYGQTVPLTFEVSGTSTVSLGGGNVSSYRPFVTGRMTSLCELNAGRMITYIQ